MLSVINRIRNQQGAYNSPFFIAYKCLIFGKRNAINEMNHIPPFEQVLGLGIIGTLASILDMNESLKFLILILTFCGLVIKLWEQIKKSEHFLPDIKKLWAKFKK
jgi:hypothetical protein